MSVVIIGGNERMVYKYEDICKNYGVDAKVFAKKKRDYKEKSRYTGSAYLVYKYRLTQDG